MILDNCFNGDKTYGPNNSKLARDLFVQPLFGALVSESENARRTSCCVLKELNRVYIDDPNFVNIFHCHTMASLGVKHDCNECEFLMAITDLVNGLGVETTLGEALHKFLPHFVKSVEKNLN
jgi:hypothetical protein